MNKEEEEIETMAAVLDRAKIKALNYVGSLNKGWGNWYATELYNAGYSSNEQITKKFVEELRTLKRVLKMRAKEYTNWDGNKVQAVALDLIDLDLEDLIKEVYGGLDNE